MEQKTICILDYGSGNVKSVYNVVHYLGYNVQISNEPEVIRSCTHIILPGVGAFGASMEKIRKNISISILEEEVIQKKKPFLGICVGMQVLADKGMEFGEHKGLGWIGGVVDKIDSKGEPLPHMGWNNIEIIKDSPLFLNLKEYRDFYFVHSFVFNVNNDSHVLAKTEYGSEFICLIKKDNIYGIQFHPEKSQKAGQLLLKNFIENI